MGVDGSRPTKICDIKNMTDSAFSIVCVIRITSKISEKDYINVYFVLSIILGTH